MAEWSVRDKRTGDTVNDGMKFRLNPNLDAKRLATRYAEANRLRVENILTEDSAKEIHKRLSELDWWLTYNDGDHVNQLHPLNLRQLTQQDSVAIQQKIFENARKQYQFIYNYYPMFAGYFSPRMPAMSLDPVYEFLNSEHFLEFARALTGQSDIRWCDAQATLFRPTHFLKYHTDAQSEQKRRAAYVLNFTSGWDTDWGGMLQFWNEQGDVELALKPTFNALNIFTVPQPHSVSSVTQWAPGLRFSITGWMRADDPPGPIGAG